VSLGPWAKTKDTKKKVEEGINNRATFHQFPRRWQSAGIVSWTR